MKTLTHKTVLALVAALTVASIAASAAVASQPQPLLLAPGEPNGPYFPLPKFGFSSYNIGMGERVTYVSWNGRASQLGLQPGDVILSMNGIPLSYTGSWNDALRTAIMNGGWVQLRIRDRNTGFVAFRQTFVGDGGYGPIVDNYCVDNYHNDCPTPHVYYKNHNHDNHHNGNGVNVIDLVKLFKDSKKKNKP